MAAQIPDPWGRSALERLGFVGWHRFGDLGSHLSSIPSDAGGVYVVYREADTRPSFLARSPGGTWGGDPTVAIEVLRQEWVDGAHVLNIGKANRGRLRSRLREYHSFGSGGTGRHRGGRYIWQIAGAWDLLVAWRVTAATEVPRTLEERMIAAFCTAFGARPFANLTD
jgi:hypothetical protein